MSEKKKRSLMTRIAAGIIVGLLGIVSVSLLCWLIAIIWVSIGRLF